VSVEFDPVKIGPRRRRIDPVAVGILVVVVALLAAVVKPWEHVPVAVVPPLPSLADTVPVVTPSPSSRPSQPVPSEAPPVAPPLTSTDLAAVITPHDAWGVRAILLGGTAPPERPLAPRFIDRWTPMTSAGTSNSAFVQRDEEWIVALGVTVPPGTQPRSMRIFRVHEGIALEWIDAHAIYVGDGDRSLLLVRPGTGGQVFTPWDAGRYRIDTLVDGGIERIAVSIPSRFGIVPPPEAWDPSRPGLVPAAVSDPSDVRSGLFATVDGIGVPLAALQSGALSEDQAWVDLAEGDGRTVASAYLPRATGLGVMLTSHASVQVASIQRVVPGPLVRAPASGGGISSLEGQTPYVLFAAANGAVWTPGLYAITVGWTDPNGQHKATWNVELRPGAG